MKLRIATCRPLPEPDPDEAPLGAALAAAGVDVHLAAWDDPAVDWDAPVPTLIRSTWNYAPRRDAFVAWCERVERAAPLINPAAIIRANSHKRYLLDLAARGVDTIPTVLVSRDEGADAIGCAAMLAGIVTERDWSRVVIKPAVGAASLGARVFSLPAARAGAGQHLAEWSLRGDVLVQPYIASVEDYGERSLIWIDGAITHAVRKSPRLDGHHEDVTGPHPIADDERALALAAIAPFAQDILYARVDMARDGAGRPRVMELELIEPSLWFACAPSSLDRYVAGLLRRLREAGAAQPGIRGDR